MIGGGAWRRRRRGVFPVPSPKRLLSTGWARPAIHGRPPPIPPSTDDACSGIELRLRGPATRWVRVKYCVDRLGPVDAVALGEVHAQFAQRGADRVVLGVLGDGLLVQHVRDVGDRADHRHRQRRALQVAHEAAVDLEVVHVQRAQVVERTEAGAEVVEREARSRASASCVISAWARARSRTALVSVTSKHSLCAGSRLLRTRWYEEHAEAFVHQRGRGQVDRAGVHRRAAASGRASSQRQRQVDHVPVERHAELEALGGGDELVRRQALAGVRVAHAQQHLEVPALAAASVAAARSTGSRARTGCGRSPRGCAAPSASPGCARASRPVPGWPGTTRLPPSSLAVKQAASASDSRRAYSSSPGLKFTRPMLTVMLSTWFCQPTR